MRTRIVAGIVLSLAAATSNAAAVSGQGAWETTLQGRAPLTPGGADYQAYYDTDLNITWLADANAAAGSIYDDLYPYGSTTWDHAQAWIASLNAANYLGVSNWRLPTVTDASRM